jgi:hypothetical protein
VLVEIGDRDIGTFTGKQHSDRAADAAIAAGDQRDLIAQLVGALVVRRIVHRREPEIGLLARLFEMLGGQRQLGIFAGPGLHRGVLGFRLVLLLGVDAPLHLALMLRRPLGAPGK